MVFGLAADDERRARFVNEDGVDLVDDGKVEATLDPIVGLVDHVVAQVVKAIFVVGAVGDVGTVGRLLFLAGRVWRIDPYGQTQKFIQLAHPARVAAGQVVVDCDHVHATASQGI